MDGEVIIPVDLDTKRFDRQIEQVEGKLEEIDEMLKHPKDYNLTGTDVEKLQAEAEKLNNKLVSLNQQKQKWNQEDFRGIDLTNIGNATENIIRKVLKWGLALFSIRSAYSFIRNSISELSQSNEQIGADIEYIRWALASTLQPIIEFIIKLVYNLLGLINSISMALFGVNLFANASAEAFKKTKDNLKGSNKEAKELQKTLTGFDEMNIIQDSGSASPGGGGGGVALPSTDLSTMVDTQGVIDLFNGIKEGFLGFWDDIIQFWEEDWWEFFSSIGGDFGQFFEGLGGWLKGFWEVVQSIGEFIIGLGTTIVGAITGDTQLLQDGIGIMVDAVWNFIKGLFEMILGKFTMIVGAIKGVILTVARFVYDNIVKPVLDFFGSMFNRIVDVASWSWNRIKDIFGGVANFFGSVFGTAWNVVKNIFSTGGQIFMGIVDGIAHAFGSIVNAIIGGINKIVSVPFNAINGALNTIRNIDIPLIGQPFKGFWKQDPISVPQIPLIPLAKGGIVNMPSRGVPIAGERGQEGVIPLTDSQQMDLLGQSIGKYITMNATIPIYVGNRQIARELRTINNESDFAFNR